MKHADATSPFLTDLVHEVCDRAKYTESNGKCFRCAPEIETPHGKGVPGCYAIANETISMVLRAHEKAAPPVVKNALAGPEEAAPQALVSEKLPTVRSVRCTEQCQEAVKALTPTVEQFIKASEKLNASAAKDEQAFLSATRSNESAAPQDSESARPEHGAPMQAPACAAPHDKHGEGYIRVKPERFDELEHHEQELFRLEKADYRTKWQEAVDTIITLGKREEQLESQLSNARSALVEQAHEIATLRATASAIAVFTAQDVDTLRSALEESAIGGTRGLHDKLDALREYVHGESK